MHSNHRLWTYGEESSNLPGDITHDWEWVTVVRWDFAPPAILTSQAASVLLKNPYAHIDFAHRALVVACIPDCCSCSLQKQVSCFNHRVVTLVPDKLERHWLPEDIFGMEV